MNDFNSSEYFDEYKDSDNEDANMHITINSKILVNYKIKQFIKYGINIDNLKIPRFYKYIIKDYLGQHMDAIDNYMVGEDDNMHFWITVPSNSELTDSENNVLAGHFLAQKFKKEMNGLLMSNATPAQVEYFNEMDKMRAKVKYKIRDEYWTKQKGEDKIKMLNDIGRVMGDGFKL